MKKWWIAVALVATTAAVGCKKKKDNEGADKKDPPAATEGGDKTAPTAGGDKTAPPEGDKTAPPAGDTAVTGTASAEDKKAIEETLESFKKMSLMDDDHANYNFISDATKTAFKGMELAKKLDAARAGSPEELEAAAKKYGVTGEVIKSTTDNADLIWKISETKSKADKAAYEKDFEDKVTNIDVEGDKATVKMTKPDGTADPEETTLVKEGGHWLIDISKHVPEMDKMMGGE